MELVLCAFDFPRQRCGGLTSDCVAVGKLNDSSAISAVQLATLG